MKQKYLNLEDTLGKVIQEGVIFEEVAEILKRVHWYNESPLEEDTPTQLLEDLVKLAGYRLKYYSMIERNLDWLEPLGSLVYISRKAIA